MIYVKKLLFAVVLILVGVTAFAYTIDHLCMSSGDEVVFFTWGKDYVPAKNNGSDKDEQNISDASDMTAQSTDAPAVKTVEVSLYFSDEDIMNLKPEIREFKEDEDIALSIARAVASGPKKDDLYALLPSESEVLSASISDDGLCTVDMNREFCEFDGGSYMENMAVFSLVNSLCSYDKINKVKINVEGNEEALFGNHYSLDVVFEADMSLVAR